MTVPTRSRRLIVVSVAYLLFISIWVGPEDSIWAAALLGSIGGLLAMLNLVTQWWGGRSLSKRNWYVLNALGGAATGLAAVLVTALLMTIKTAVHAHGTYTDYPPQVILGILQRTPLWTTSGLLLGFGLALATSSLRSSKS